MKMLLPLTVLILILSCTPGGAAGAADGGPVEGGMQESALLASGREGSLEWSVTGPAGDIYYTDRIPLTITLDDSDGGLTGDSLPAGAFKAGAIWGDFRVYDLLSSGRSTLSMLMVPLKTGDLKLAAPGEFPFDMTLNLQVFSRIDETGPAASRDQDKDPEPSGLILEDESSLIWVIPVVLIVVICAVAGLLIFRAVHKRKASRDLGEDLSSFIEEAEKMHSGTEIQSAPCLDFYRRFYPHFVNELTRLHPAVCSSDSPEELKAHLEEPSSMNQWALRGLYGLLDDLERIFYTPGGEDRASENFLRNTSALKEWFALKETGEGDK